MANTRRNTVDRCPLQTFGFCGRCWVWLAMTKESGVPLRSAPTTTPHALSICFARSPFWLWLIASCSDCGATYRPKSISCILRDIIKIYFKIRHGLGHSNQDEQSLSTSSHPLVHVRRRSQHNCVQEGPL